MSPSRKALGSMAHGVYSFRQASLAVSFCPDSEPVELKEVSNRLRL